MIRLISLTNGSDKNMKIVKASEMARIEQMAYQQGASEKEFMDRAGNGVAELVQSMIARYHLEPKIHLLCGKGNNAGDAYVAGSILRQGGFQVTALALAPLEESSPLCQLQSKRFVKAGGIIEYIENEESISFKDSQLLVDGIFGTGFQGEARGVFHTLIEAANSSRLPILSVDIPSGINGNTGEFTGSPIHAKETLFLGLPKTGCFLDEAWNWVGKIHLFDFGLDPAFIEEAKEDFILIDDPMIHRNFPPIVRNRHKYQAGYVVGLGGSAGMPGAPLMAAEAALRSGAGIVRLLHPEGMGAQLSAAAHEVIRQGYREGDFKTILMAMERASALFIGPGVGTSSATLKLLKKILANIDRPAVIDADALTLLAQNPVPFPPNTILTPQQGEMKRLLGVEGEIPFKELLRRSHDFSEQNGVTLVLKGAPTFVFHPGITPHVCARGDPGMATAGSGDVLTGVIAAFFAQIHDPFKAALFGVQLHAIAGEYAAEELTSYCMTATDITKHLPQVFKIYSA
ncbi:MAG: NAD(P)H-hydrate dehydratase [Chlamydiales bacterium]